MRKILYPALLALMSLCSPAAFAGGPRWVAGSTYFNSSAQGKPIVWAGGSIVYYTDQGELSSYESNTAAATMVAAAALPWTQVSTASVSITLGGTLDEDVNGSNVSGSRGNVTWPADVESAAKPVAVIYDTDGSVLNVVLGAGGSDPSACMTNAVTSINDGFSTAGYLTHAIIILNGLCAGNANQVANMQYLLTREFGRVLGLGWSQANDNVFTGNPLPTEADWQGWPLMHPINFNCGTDNFSCVPYASTLKMDDRAALGRLYPSSTFYPDTIHVSGTLSFADGQGMQGVNVKAVRLWTNTTQQDTSMVASCVTGFEFRGNAGNVVTGTVDSAGNPLARFGSTNATLEGWYSVIGLEIPSGQIAADYEIIFEPINPLYTGAYAVGPETLGAPAPSGTLTSLIKRDMGPGAGNGLSEAVSNSASGPGGLAGSFAAPNAVPAGGSFSSHLSGYGDTDYVTFAGRPNRQFALLTTAYNESGEPSESKAMPVIGAWFADDAAGATPDFDTPNAFDSSSEGVTMLEITTPAGDGAESYPMVAAIADARGDGRPDYAYSGRLLYADSVSPDAVPASGGVVAISGEGFVAGDSVQVNGASARVLSLSATQIVVQTPVLAASGAVDVQVNDPTGAFAVMSGALVVSSGATSGYELNIVSLPGGSGGSSGAVGAPAPGSFAVQVADSNGNPVSGAQVTFSDSNGSQLSACGGATHCTDAASSSGIAATALTPQNAGVETVTAALADGTTAQIFYTATGPAEAVQFADVPLEVAAGQAISWPLTITAVNSSGQPEATVTITWKVTQNGKTLATASSATNAAGVATYTAAIPALNSGSSATVTACLADGTCGSATATGVAADAPVAIAWSGTAQTIAANATFAPLALQITDGSFPGNPLAGVTVTFAESYYSYEPAGAGAKQPPPRLLAQSSGSTTSNAPGMVSIQPLQQAGVAGTVVVTATIGARTAGTWTLLAEPAAGASQGGPVALRSFHK